MQIARSIGQQKATTYKQLTRLVDVGLVRHEPDGTYRTGPKLRSIAQQLLLANDRTGIANEILEDLREVTGETATIVGVDQGMGRIFHRAESHNLISVNLHVGDRFDLVDSASALILLAHDFTAAEREALRAESPDFPSEEMLRDVIDRGYACSIDKLVAGLAAVAVPYRIPQDPKQYALTLVAPTFRFDLDASVAALLEYACE